MKKVLVYKSSLLPYSETFIKEQILALHAWRGVLVGDELIRNGLDLTGIDIRLTNSAGEGRRHRVVDRIARGLGRPKPSVVNKLAAEEAQLVHIHFGTNAVSFYPIARALRLPILVTLHGADINIDKHWWEAGNGGASMRSYPRRLIDIARRGDVGFIAVSQAIRERAIEYGIPAECIVSRYIGVDIEKFSPGTLPINERSCRVLFVGRLVEKKGCEYLIRAFSQVQQTLHSAELVVIGDGPLMAHYEQLARQVGCRVRFLGAVRPQEVKRQLDHARVLCLPSITAANGDAEGLPVVICEAQASGVPVITSARGGATEGIRHLETGLAHGEGDIDGLAAGLHRMLTDDQLLLRLSASARKHAQLNFDIKRCTRLLEETYDAEIDK